MRTCWAATLSGGLVGVGAGAGSGGAGAGAGLGARALGGAAGSALGGFSSQANTALAASSKIPQSVRVFVTGGAYSAGPKVAIVSRRVLRRLELRRSRR